MLLAETPARNRAIRERAIREAEEWVRAHIWALEDATVQELYGLFLDSFAELSQALLRVFLNQVPGDEWSVADANYRARTEALLAQINAQVAELIGASQDAAFSAAARAMAAGAMGRAWVLDLGLRGAADVLLPLLPTEAIRAAILMPYEGLTFLDRFANARAEFETIIRRAVVRSQIEGDGIAQAVRRLREALGIAGDESKALRARVEMIARTEILRASNTGALATYDANKDVLTGWEFIATRDERTCPVCGALDGKQYALDAVGPRPPQHPRCRCSILPVLKDQALQDAIAGKRETYAEWAARRGVSIVNDGGVFKFRGRAAPKSQTPAAQAAAVYPRA